MSTLVRRLKKIELTVFQDILIIQLVPFPALTLAKNPAHRALLISLWGKDVTSMPREEAVSKRKVVKCRASNIAGNASKVVIFAVCLIFGTGERDLMATSAYSN